MDFCNNILEKIAILVKNSHNPYFNRWFSAIENEFLSSLLRDCHNPYFNRWFSAIKEKTLIIYFYT